MKQFRRFIGFLAPYKGRILIITVLMLINSGMAIVVPQITRYVIDETIPQKDFALLTKVALLAIGFFILKAGLHFVNMFVTFLVTQEIILNLRMKVYKQILRLSLRYFETHLSGTILSRIINDVDSLQQMILATASRLIGEFVTLIVVIIILFVVNPRLAAVSLSFIPALALVRYRFSKRIRDISRKIRQKVGDMTGIVTEVLQGIRVVKSFAMERTEYNKFLKENFGYKDLNVDRRKEVGIIESSGDFLSQMGILMVLWFGGYLIMKNNLTLGELTAYILYIRMILMPIHSLIMFNNILQGGLASFERICEILDTPEDIKEADNPIRLSQVQGKVEFRDVDFAYDGSQKVLNKMSFSVHAGKVIALVGPSGAGKTSIVNLIPRFYDPVSGDIFLDSVNLKDLELGFLRDQMGIVLQDPVLFSGTVKENISYAKEDAKFSEIQLAARLANAEEFIERLPNKYDTQIGERGVKLSGGQKQRIAIARAILKNPKILILDEATSSLDSESEMLIQKALENLLRNRTTFVIAHRLSTIVNADKILVLDDGKIVEEGTHEELLEKNGLYRKLHDVQFKIDNELKD